MVVLSLLRQFAKTEIGLGGTTLIVINELTRHMFTALALVASIHVTAAFVEWIAHLTGTSIMTDPLAGPFKLKHALVLIDLALMGILALQGYREIQSIFRDRHRSSYGRGAACTQQLSYFG